MSFRERVLEYLFEENKLKKKGIVVFDIDNTLLIAKDIFIWLTKDGKDVKKFSPEQYDAFTKQQKDELTKDGSKFDFREFRDDKKIYDSIVNGKGHLNMLRLLDSNVKAGYDVGILTARGCEESVRKAINDWLRTKNSEGKFVEINPNVLKKENIQAINDDDKNKAGVYSGFSKAPYLKAYLTDKGYDIVKFVDDSHTHLADARKLQNLAKDMGKQLHVIDANKVNKK